MCIQGAECNRIWPLDPGRMPSYLRGHTAAMDTGKKSPTVLPGTEERGVQHHSLASFLISSIPADLRSYLRS